METQPKTDSGMTMKMNRRTLLRATGVAMGLPVLESFGASSTQKSPRRMLAINQDLGFIPKLFFPKGEGRNYELSNYLEKIAGHRDQFTVFSGLSHPCLLYTSPSPRDRTRSRMPSSA